MKYQLIHQGRSQVPIKSACKILGVSRSGYYKNLKRPKSKREIENAALLAEIKRIHKKSRKRMGSPTITQALRRKGWKINEKRVARLMRMAGLKSVHKKKFKRTTDSSHPHPPAQNLIANRGPILQRNEIWVSDITYIWTYEGWLYLCIFMDLATRKIVGWAISERLKASLVVDAFVSAVLQENPPAGLIVHSDRGRQYASAEFRNYLKPLYRQSMTGPNHCYDNAFAESFFHTLKVEWLYQTTLKTRRQARNEIFEYIEIYYNRLRLHSGINYLTPLEMETKVQKVA